MKLIRIFIALTSIIFFSFDIRTISNQDLSQHHNTPWLQFKIRAIETADNRREVISETQIAGPAGIDFDINLQDKNFILNTDFITDLIDADHLQIRTAMMTKRLVGNSQRGLPVYEEDHQQHSFQVSADEMVELLPFGRNRQGSTLKIEIEPELLSQNNNVNQADQSLKIKIIKSSPQGLINVSARKIPHDFIITARLLIDGRVIAQSAEKCRYRQPENIKLIPTANQDSNLLPLTISMNVVEYLNGCPTDSLTINFDLSQDQVNSNLKVIGQNWAGVGALGETLEYNLSEIMPDVKGRPTLQLMFQQPGEKR